MTTTPFRQDNLPLEWERRAPARTALPPSRVAADRALHRWIGQLCAGVAEVAAGDRPARQLFLVMTPATIDRLQRRSRLHPSANGPIRRVLSLRVTSPNPGTLEATAVVEGARRCQAVALQLRQRRKGWLVTAAEIR